MAQPLNYCPVRFQALIQPQRIAIKEEQHALTYKQLDERIDSLQKQLSLQKLKSGDRLVCIAPNSINLILLQLTCLRSGIIFCPLNPRFSDPEISSRLAILNSEFIYLAPEQARLHLSRLSLDFTAPDHPEFTNTQQQIDPLQVINIIFTSGSSGQAKAAMHHFSNHYYSALGSQKRIPLRSGDNNLLSLPLFHISGYATVLRTILAGATVFLSDTPLTVAQLKKLQITHLSLVSTQLTRLLESSEFRQDNLPIKHLLLGGSAFSAGLLKETQQRGFSYHLSYGLTEMSSQVATSSNSSALFILKYRQLRIIEGEIFLRGKTRFAGYFNGLMADSLIPETQWFASKDLGKLVAGSLQLIGRKDRMFICGGENIQPEEIESLLLTLPAIKQAYVVAINDPAFGKRPVAFIDGLNEIQPQAVDNYLKDKLSRYKRPVYYFLLPPSSGIKVSLTELQQLAQKCVDEILCSNR